MVGYTLLDHLVVHGPQVLPDFDLNIAPQTHNVIPNHSCPFTARGLVRIVGTHIPFLNGVEHPISGHLSRRPKATYV
jgi:hypothetical protein